MSIFEVSPANDVIVPALVKLIAHNNWKQLALVVENRQDYSQVYFFEHTTFMVLTSIQIIMHLSKRLYHMRFRTGFVIS